MPFDNRKLLGASAAALACALAAPAAAETAPMDDAPVNATRPTPASEEAPSTGPNAPAAEMSSEDRLVPLSTAKGHIRGFGGGILPNAGRIRTFAGPVAGTAGRIRTFDATASAADVQAAAGRIRTFAGRIRTFSNDVTPTIDTGAFWGSLKPAAGTLSASAGRIRTFQDSYDLTSGKIRESAGRIRTFAGRIRTFSEAAADYKLLNDGFATLISDTKAEWGATIQSQTGKSFEDAFATKILADYKIDPKNPSMLAGMDEFGIEMFLLDWYDNLMLYSGRDSVDHWMKTANWSPLVTQNLSGTVDTKIGILDFGIAAGDGGTIIKTGGYTGVDSIHGSAVASLIGAKHDGRGVMGIAPNAQVISYNPFDSSLTASWADVKTGVAFLLNNGASVINASLGVPGVTLHNGWNDIFKDNAISAEARKRVFVLAAGNEGVTHSESTEIEWNFDRNPNIIIVGSVTPDGASSAFSNKPGQGKLKKMAGNDPYGTDRIRDRFITAPGEFMLVSDGKGGVTRMSGTSFAAPLVSGTIALLHDRWPWLADNPLDTVNIILGSARDVGPAGTDDTYGRGILDVQKALEPASFEKLTFKRYVDGVVQDMSAATVRSTSKPLVSSWELNDDVYFYAFEKLPGVKSEFQYDDKIKDSYRDFNIPVSTRLIGQTVGTTGEQFDAYLRSRFLVWVNSPTTSKVATSHFASPMASIGGLETEAVAVPREYRPGLRQSSSPFDTGLAMRSPGGGFAVRFGSGDGSGFTGQQGFGLRSDYDVVTGGANPFLGLASGAGYASIEMRLGDRVSVSTGVSQQNAVMDLDRMSDRERFTFGGVDAYRATANTITVAYRASDRFSTSLGYTLLNEDTGLLGVRSVDPTDLSDGSATDAATFGADYALTDKLSFSLAGTVGRTRAGDTGSQGIAVAKGGIVSSAWQVAATRQGLIDGQDSLRLSFAQPLHVEAGEIALSMAKVVDRQTGEIGEVVQLASAAQGGRRFVAEAIYGRKFGGNAEFGLFGRANINGDDRAQAAVTLGGNFRLGF